MFIRYDLVLKKNIVMINLGMLLANIAYVTKIQMGTTLDAFVSLGISELAQELQTARKIVYRPKPYTW